MAPPSDNSSESPNDFDFMTEFIEYPDDSSDKTGSAAKSQKRTFSHSDSGGDEGPAKIHSSSKTFDSSNNNIVNTFDDDTFDARSMLPGDTASRNALSKTANTFSVAPSTSATSDSRVPKPSAYEAADWRNHENLLLKLARGTKGVEPIWIKVKEYEGADDAWKLYVREAKADDYVKEVKDQWIGWFQPSSDVNDQLKDQALKVTSRIHQVIGFLEGDYRKKAYTKSAVPDGARRQLRTTDEIKLKSNQTRVLVKLLFGIRPDESRPVASPVAEDDKQFLLNTVQIRVEEIADALVPLGLDAKEDHANDDDDKGAGGKTDVDTDVDAEGETDSEADAEGETDEDPEGERNVHVDAEGETDDEDGR